MAAGKQAEGPESEEEDNLEEDEHSDGNESDARQSNTALTRARPSKNTMRSRPQPKKSKSAAINREQSVQLGTSNDETIQPHRPHPTTRINVSRQQSIQPSGSRSQLSRSGNITQRGYPHPLSHTGTHYDAPPNSTRLHLQAPPPSLSPPRPATKRRNPGWSDDDSAQLDTALRNRRIDTQRQFIPRSEADSWDSRNSQTIVPQQSHQRHHQYSDAPHTSTNKRQRVDVLQGRASHSIPRGSQVQPSMPSTSQQHHAAGYRQPPPFRSRERYRQVHAASPIEEEDMHAGDRFMYAPGDPSGYGDQYTGYHQEDAPYSSRGIGREGSYFDDGYDGEE